MDRSPSEASQGLLQISVFAIVVCYKVRPAESASLITLLEAAHAAAPERLRLTITVADNTLGGQDPGSLPPEVQYRRYPQNPGLAQPYNEALLAAERAGYDWLLLLDHDTELPADFLIKIQRHVERFASVERVAAIVPHIADAGRPISPFRYAGGFLPRMLPEELDGIAPPHTSALNSTSLLRVSALRRIGGYDPRFPLHNSDTDLYLRLQESGLRVAVAGDLVVQHQLSILKREQRMRPERYREMLRDECEFWDRRMSALGRAERLLRLAGRVCKGYLRGEAREYRRVAAQEFWHRLTTCRHVRLRSYPVR